MNIKKLKVHHWKAVKYIYEAGIATRNATFEILAPDWEVWNKNHLAHSRLICELDERVAGWVALSPVSEKCIFTGVA